jgi:hypothetical protein
MRVRLLLSLVCALAVAPAAAGGSSDAEALADRYAPVVRLVEQEEECGYGEPYVPIDVDVLFGEPTVALRGPWGPADLIRVEDLSRGLYEHHLDFPGNALDPGCDYERWGDRVTKDAVPTVYAHVASDPAFPGKLALQYWLFYVFNDYNNKHEGDWEMIQLVFDADDAESALATEPAEVGYSQHEGAERADWDDEKLELVDGTHPVVHSAAGSHANYFQEALFLGRSAAQGVGCDDTSGPTVDVRPLVQTIPADADAARRAFPWIAFEGRWGELQRAFFNGPTGPNLKSQWNEPIVWSEDWRPRSYAIPTGGVLGTGATDFFCTAVETGSKGLVALLRNPALTLLTLAALIALVAWALTRTTWKPVAPLRLARRRSWGQILAAAGRMYVKRTRLFLGIGLLLIPLGFVISLVEAVVLGGFGLLGVETTGESAGALVLLVATVGTTLALLGLALVQAATTCALVKLDEGRDVGPVHAYRLALPRFRPLAGGLAFAVAVSLVLSATAILIPVAIWLGVRWALLAQTVELDGRGALGGLRRSAELVRGRWLRVASLVGVGAALVLAAGPLLGALLILLTDMPLPLLNVVAGVVYALTMPFVALVTAYVYFDARVREELETEQVPEVLPAEIELELST